MFSLSSSHQFYLYKSACDMRKSFDSLCGLVQNELNQVAHNGSVYIFINRRCNQMKLLHWEAGGFVLYHKRLEQGTFAFPVHDRTQISWSDLVLMIEGIQVIKSNQKKRVLLHGNELRKLIERTNFGAYKKAVQDYFQTRKGNLKART